MRTTYWNVPAWPTSRSQFGSREILIAARSVGTLTTSCGAVSALLAAVRSEGVATPPGLVATLDAPALGVPALGAPALGVLALRVPALGAPALGFPVGSALGVPALGVPDAALDAPALGVPVVPALGVPALDAPALGAPALGAPALGVPDAALDAPALDAPALGAPALGAPALGVPDAALDAPALGVPVVPALGVPVVPALAAPALGVPALPGPSSFARSALKLAVLEPALATLPALDGAGPTGSLSPGLLHEPDNSAPAVPRAATRETIPISITPEKTASDDPARIVAHKRRWPQAPAISATVASFRTWRGSQLLRHPGP